MQRFVTQHFNDSKINLSNLAPELLRNHIDDKDDRLDRIPKITYIEI